MGVSVMAGGGTKFETVLVSPGSSVAVSTRSSERREPQAGRAHRRAIQCKFQATF